MKRFFQWTLAYIRWIRWSILFRTLCNYITYLDFWYIQNLSRFRTQSIIYGGSLKYSLHRTLCNLDIFITYIYSNPSILRTRGIWWTVFCGTLCNPDIFRNLEYSQLWYILKSKHIQSPAKYLRWTILLKTCVAIAYLDAWYIQNFRFFRTRLCQLPLNVSAIL